MSALTDTLLLLRYVLVLRDAALVSGAVGGGCTLCTADEIETFIDPLVP